MDCAQIGKLIPLYIGGDLESTHADDLRSHIEICARCRQLAADFEESRDWLRRFAVPEFDGAVFDDLRDAVQREVARTQPESSFRGLIATLWNPQFVIAASLALLLLVAGLAFYVYRQESPRPAPIAIVDHDSDLAAAREKTGTAVTQWAPGSITKKNSNQRSGRRISSVMKTDLKTNSQDQSTFPGEPVAASAVEADLAISDPLARDDDPETLRIELQTADPNIRIIWFAQKTGSSRNTKP